MALTLMEERRKKFGPDLWSKTILWAGVGTWGFLIVVFLVIGIGKAETESLLEGILGINLHQSWTDKAVIINLALMIYLFALSLAGWVFSSRKPAHKEQKYVGAFRLLCLLSAVGVMSYFILF